MALVHLQHPTLPPDQLICIPDHAVPGHEIAGWVIVPDPEPIFDPEDSDESA